MNHLAVEVRGLSKTFTSGRRALDSVNLRIAPGEMVALIGASWDEHAAIVDAIAAGDADKAGKLLYEHAMESRDRLHAALEHPRKKAKEVA